MKEIGSITEDAGHGHILTDEFCWDNEFKVELTFGEILGLYNGTADEFLILCELHDHIIDHMSRDVLGFAMTTLVNTNIIDEDDKQEFFDELSDDDEVSDRAREKAEQIAGSF